MNEQPDILPDSRLKRTVGAKPGPGGWWVPVFCAVCGAPHGYVPEENCNFACWLCNDCSEVHGVVFGAMAMPDEVWWAKVAQEQLEKYQRLLSTEDLEELHKHGNTALAKLLKEGPQNVK